MFLTVLIACLPVLASAAPLFPRSNLGNATYYAPNLPTGTCSFSTYTLPAGIFGSALSDSNWDNAAKCGACVSVTVTKGKSITAMIVDQCPGCGPNHLDLFPEAFAVLENPVKGVINVAWDIVPCPITTPIQLHAKDGASQSWFSMQVVNANKAVNSLEVSKDGGNSWVTTERQYYNFFEHMGGFGAGNVDVKVTSTAGDVLVVKDVPVVSDGITTASSNFKS